MAETGAVNLGTDSEPVNHRRMGSASLKLARATGVLTHHAFGYLGNPASEKIENTRDNSPITSNRFHRLSDCPSSILGADTCYPILPLSNSNPCNRSAHSSPRFS